VLLKTLLKNPENFFSKLVSLLCEGSVQRSAELHACASVNVHGVSKGRSVVSSSYLGLGPYQSCEK